MEFVLTTAIMAPGACKKPGSEPPCMTPFPEMISENDLNAICDRVPGASFVRGKSHGVGTVGLENYHQN